MDKPLLPSALPDVSSYTDFVGLARLKTSAQKDEQSPETLKKVAQQFESLFLEMMLKSMRDAKLSDGIFDSDAGDTYLGMFDKQIAMDLSQGKGLGISELLMRQLGQKAAAAGQTNGALPVQPKAQGEARPITPADFVREILPYARKTALNLGVHPLGLIAQAAVETGWGQHLPKGESGSSFNLFGIKAGEGWSGEKVAARTLEVQDGMPVLRQASFRSYGSLADSFADYEKLIAGSPRYQGVLQQGATPEGFADAMGRSGYATDPNYASKIKGILTGDTLRDALRSLKQNSIEPMI